jgi:hypothetical protein
VTKHYRSQPTISHGRQVGVADDGKIKKYKNGVASDGMISISYSEKSIK